MRRNEQSGQLMIIVAVGLVLFIGFAALVVDLGHAYAERRLAQNAADAATMAGAQKARAAGATVGDVAGEVKRVALLNGNSRINRIEFLGVDGATILGIATGDGASDQGFTYSGGIAAATLAETVAGVRVLTTVTFNTFFAGAFGALLPTIQTQASDINTLTAAGQSAAMCMEVGSVSGTGIWPIVSKDQPFVPGTDYLVWDDVKEEAGNAGWADLNGGGGGASELSSWMANGFQSSAANPFEYWNDAPGPSVGTEEHSNTLPFPSWIGGATGDKTSVLGNVAVGQTITIMVYSETNGGTGANAKYRVVGLARFVITEVDSSGNDKRVVASFQEMVYTGDPNRSTYTTGDSSTVRMVPNAVPTSLPTPTPPPLLPAAPTGLMAEKITDDRAVELNWSDNSSNETGFRIERSGNQNDWSGATVINVSAGTQHYTDTGLQWSTTYYYRVRAYSGPTTWSSWAGPASARTDSEPPPPKK